MTFKDKVLKIVSKIPEGTFLTYEKVAKLAGQERAYRAVANILAKNKNSQIPCHRVVKNDYTVGGYFGSYKNSWEKLALLLKEGVIAVMPTDTIYGICGNALKKEVVERIYKLRKRSPHKPMIILISSFDDLKIFGVDGDADGTQTTADYTQTTTDIIHKRDADNRRQKTQTIADGTQTTADLKQTNKELEILRKIWPGKVSVILEMKRYFKKFEYLHRGTKTLAFRLPKPKWLRNILKISGPLVAPSANWEGYEPAKTISEAKKYFGNKVIYYDRGKIKGQPSTLIKLKDGKIEILRKGAGYNLIFNLQKTKIQKFLSNSNFH